MPSQDDGARRLGPGPRGTMGRPAAPAARAVGRRRAPPPLGARAAPTGSVREWHERQSIAGAGAGPRAQLSGRRGPQGLRASWGASLKGADVGRREGGQRRGWNGERVRRERKLCGDAGVGTGGRRQVPREHRVRAEARLSLPLPAGECRGAAESASNPQGAHWTFDSPERCCAHVLLQALCTHLQAEKLRPLPQM